MTIKEYQKLAMRTSPPDHDRVMNGRRYPDGFDAERSLHRGEE